ncbi:WD40-repeat-containing domain protein [Mycena sp. CBHHK59/15]|nr:WD40-repeat-containing domain protein [Mycena sp. CBHHK59/15]
MGTTQYGNIVTSQTEELGLMRQSLNELRAKHADFCCRSAVEIDRLRGELHTLGPVIAPGRPPHALGPPNAAETQLRFVRLPQDTALFNIEARRTLDLPLLHKFANEMVVCCIQFSADDKHLVTGCNQTAQVYELRTGERTCVLVDPSVTHVRNLWIRSARFSPDGRFLATGAGDGKLRVWDLEKRLIVMQFSESHHEISSLDFSPDGRLIVSGSETCTPRIWSLDEGSCRVLHGPGVVHGSGSMAVSRSGRFVVAGGHDSVVRIWDLRNGQLIHQVGGMW